jgi:hypothetical protein
VAAVDIGGGRLAFGAPARQGFPQGRPLGTRRADDVFHAVLVEDLDKYLAAIHLALYHVVVSFSITVTIRWPDWRSRMVTYDRLDL